jgi:hypothetical protein
MFILSSKKQPGGGGTMAYLVCRISPGWHYQPSGLVAVFADNLEFHREGG